MFTPPLQGVCCCVSLRLSRTPRRDGFHLSYVSDLTIGSKEVSYLEAAPIGHGLREGRLSQRYRVQAFRMSRPTMMIAFEKATQKSMTCPRLSVHHTSFL